MSPTALVRGAPFVVNLDELISGTIRPKFFVHATREAHFGPETNNWRQCPDPTLENSAGLFGKLPAKAYAKLMFPWFGLNWRAVA
jgi:hypothetical protein